MTWLIGVDEAGYGPNLGPLVVAATLWHSEQLDEPPTDPTGDPFADCELFARLAPDLAPVAGAGRDCWLPVDDSKKLYHPTSGVAPLERIVLGASRGGFSRPLSVAEQGAEQPVADQTVLFPTLFPTCWTSLRQLWSAEAADNRLGIDGDIETLEQRYPWYVTGPSLPVAVTDGELQRLAARFDALLKRKRIRLVRVAARFVEPDRFNEGCERWGNKAALLSLTTLQLVRSLMELIPADDPSPLLCRCDRHGGRAKYISVLQQVFPESWIEIRHESPRSSRYRLTIAERREAEIRFEVGSERFLETAWASVLAKYGRELAIDAFNRFWIASIPELTPTRGYPVDAKRFRSAIASVARKQGIPESLYWRSR